MNLSLAHRITSYVAFGTMFITALLITEFWDGGFDLVYSLRWFLGVVELKALIDGGYSARERLWVLANLLFHLAVIANFVIALIPERGRAGLSTPQPSTPSMPPMPPTPTRQVPPGILD